MKQAVNEDKGWLTLGDMLNTVAKSIQKGHTHEQITQRLKDRCLDELKKWGYEVGRLPEKLAEAELCAGAASSLDRVIPLEALALHWFRTKFVEPLLVALNMKGKRRSGALPANGPKMNLSGRLAHVVGELLDVQGGNSGQRHGLASDLAAMLHAVGVQQTHPIHKKLDKFLANGHQ